MTVVMDDVAMGATPDEACRRIRLAMLANKVTLRNLIPTELAAGCGLLRSRPVTSFSLVAVTPASSWRRGVQPDAGAGMVFNFAPLISQLASTRRLRAGTIVGSDVWAIRDAVHEFASIAMQSGRELDEHGEAATTFMRFGRWFGSRCLTKKEHRFFARSKVERCG